MTTTEPKPTLTQLFARWFLGIETAARDLVRPAPGSPASTLATDREARPTRDLDRLWAAAAHFAVFGGAWLILPLVIYLLHRGGSPFVRWHSFQALVLAVWTVCAIVLTVLLIGIGLVVFVLLDSIGLHKAGQVVLLVSAIPSAFVIIYSVAASAIGGIKSLAGVPWTMPIIGRIASGLIARRSGTPELPDGAR